MVSPTSQSNKKKCLSTIKIKLEEGTDEVKVFSQSTVQKNESDIDIEDRLSPVIEEPTSPNKNEPYNNYMSGFYASPFLYPYFMAAAAQANFSTDKTLTTNPFGTAFPGMPFPPLYPPGMMNQPNFFNPFGIPMPTPAASSNRQHQSSSSAYNTPPKDLNTILDTKRPKKPHVKKPLNAFMIYMKEQRAKTIEECTLKESSAINKILGQKWKELTRLEQDRYYELAKVERNRHLEMYPNWSARDNYGLKKKRQIVGVQKKVPHVQQKNSTQIENDASDPKKCRARYGLERVDQWCKHCRRKKKCTRFLEDNGNPSSVSSSTTLRSDNEDDSDDILSKQIDSIDDEHDDSNEENKQQFFSSSQFPPRFHY